LWVIFALLDPDAVCSENSGLVRSTVPTDNRLKKQKFSQKIWGKLFLLGFISFELFAWMNLGAPVRLVLINLSLLLILHLKILYCMYGS
jgi:hypothetical protein